MTAIEIKTEINKVIDDMPESALQQALDLLKEFHDRAEEAKDDLIFEKIMHDHSEVFERLAK